MHGEKEPGKKIPAEPDRNPLDSDQNLQWEKCNEAKRKFQ